MRNRVGTIVAVAVLCLASTMSWADLGPYSQDFEMLVQADPAALADDGWLVFGNVFDPGGGYLYGYGPFPAPNGGPAFCAIDAGQGGLPQGLQQLVVYSDYNNGDHGNGNLIEANVFQEQMVGPADVGSTWLFQFDAKRGNIEGATTALAFIKTLDPNAGFALTNFITVDMTDIPATWGGYLLSIYIDPSLDGQILQIGFASTATNYQGSGILYDNINFRNLEDQCQVDDDEDEDGDDDEDGDLEIVEFDESVGNNGGFIDLMDRRTGSDSSQSSNEADADEDDRLGNRSDRSDDIRRDGHNR